MGKIVLHGSRVRFFHDDGHMETLLDLWDLYANSSNVAMHMEEESEGKESISYPFAELMLPLLGLNQKTGKKALGDNIFFGAAKLFLRKHQAYQMLVIGEIPWETADYFGMVMRVFHKKSCLYWMKRNHERSSTNFVSMMMPYEHLLLPQNFFQHVFIGDLGELGFSDFRKFFDQLILSMKVYGQVTAVCSSQLERYLSIRNIEGKNYNLEKTYVIFTVSKELQMALHEDTIEFAVGTIFDTVCEKVHTIKEVMMERLSEDYDIVVQGAKEIEELLLAIYSFLESQEIKYIVNRWKEALIQYRLQLGNKTDIQIWYDRLYHELEKEPMSVYHLAIRKKSAFSFG